ncbi:MAG TPA: type III-A CRISPR-associated RAMP protein Csm3 [bacterium]|nr:type III-A CRISPR-associated RAMP protein Csm3 [bacterium]HQI47889.1 type III-A CRISPR-associated RAMP protein Csm3 [bacterium]HQJ66207.1 type III-A CRISPR-associated RAMP protein Csm3 [bacterium]
MSSRNHKPIIGKLLIKGVLRCETGLHIGSAQGNLEIGGLDSPVVRDPLSREPYIPGSSLRGKMRAILERKEGKTFDRHSGQGVYRHECADLSCTVCRLFGATGRGQDEVNQPSRLAIRDLRLTHDSLARLNEIDTGLQYTELKFENALDRITAAANPRQIERVPAGAEFRFELVYTVETESKTELESDLKNIFALLNMVQDDSIGGHGARGYGKISLQLGGGMGEVTARRVSYYTAEDEASRVANQYIASDIDSLEMALVRLPEFLHFFGLK